MEESEEIQTFDWEHYARAARRRVWYFVIPLFLGWLAVWGASWILKPVYRSGTLILVEQPAVPQQYVVPNITSNLQDRLQSITQQILSRTRLLHIIQARNLYAEERRRLTADDLVERMRKDIEIKLDRSSDRDQLSSFNVYYSSGDPHIAQEVTSELTSLFITENVQARQQQSENTTKFLESQLDEARAGLSQQENKIRQYKDQHLGELPTQLQSNLQILGGLQTQLQSEEDALNRAKQQNAYLESLSQEYRDRATQRLSKPKDQVLTGLPSVTVQLESLKKQLVDLRSRYTDRHPDVRKVEEEIANTEKIKAQLEQEAKAVSKRSTSPAAIANAVEQDNTTPMVELESQLKANQIEMANRQQAIEELQKKIAEYQFRLNQAPIREQQLADLTRGYDQSRANYDSLLSKKNESELATSLELQQKSEHFRILDPPSLPLKPYFPNRLKFCGIALMVGLMLGVGAAGVAEFLDERIYSEKEIRKFVGPNIIAEIPQVYSVADKRKRRYGVFLQWATGSMLFITILAGCALSYYRG